MALVLLVASTLLGCSGNAPPEPSATTADVYLSDRELAERLFTCVTEYGFEGELNLDDPQGPNYLFEVSEDRQATFDESRQRCADELLEAGLMRPTSEPTRDELVARYGYLVESAECLEENGVSPPAAPSLEAYLDSGGRNWVPHGAVGDQIKDLDEFNRVLRACPQLPAEP